MRTEPTAEQIDAVARALRTQFGEHSLDARVSARRILTIASPGAQAALAANLPREVMLAALVADGTLTEEVIEANMFGDGYPPGRRLVTSFEVSR
jgi:hypothetical protein